MLRAAREQGLLSALAVSTAYWRVARTIADLNGSERVGRRPSSVRRIAPASRREPRGPPRAA